VSDTPRTDAEHSRIMRHGYGGMVSLGFARSLERENIKLRAALEQLRDCDWVITLADRMGGVRDIARKALTDDKIEDIRHG